jgi:hypothetical protein
MRRDDSRLPSERSPSSTTSSCARSPKWRATKAGLARSGGLSDVETRRTRRGRPRPGPRGPAASGDGGGAPLESIQSIAFNSGDFWLTSLSWVELRDITQARQLIWEGRVTLNSIYSLVATINYDALAGQTTYESIGIVQRIANSWELEYGVMQRLDPLNNGKSSLGFQLRARLFKF